MRPPPDLPQRLGAVLTVVATLWALAPVTMAEVVVLEPGRQQPDAVIESFLAPGDFPSRQLLWTSQGEQALFTLEVSVSATPPLAQLFPERIAWPKVAGYAIRVDSGPLSLELLPPVSDEDLDAGVAIRFVLEPLGQRFDPSPHFAARIVVVEVSSTVNGRPLLRWRAPAKPSVCKKPKNAAAPMCDVEGIGQEAGSVAVSPDGSLAALSFSGMRPRIEVYDLLGEPKLRWQALLPQGSGGAIEAAFSADGRYVATLTGRGVLHRFDAQSGSEHLRIASHGRTARSVPPGHMVAVAGDAGEVTLWYLADGTIAWRLPPRQLRGPVDRLCASSDGQRLVTLEYEEARSVVRVWDIPGRRFVAQLSVDPYSVADVAVADDGRTVLVSHETRGLLMADAEGTKTFSEVPGKAARECRGRLQWMSGANRVSCALRDGERQIGLDGRVLESRSTGVEAGVWMMAPSAEGETLVAVGAGHLMVWRKPNPKEKR